MASKEEKSALGIFMQEEYNTRNNKEDNTGINTVAKVIKIISIIVAVGGFIFGLYTIDGLNTGSLVAPIIIGSVIFAVFLYALGEIIQLLEDIKNK